MYQVAKTNFYAPTYSGTENCVLTGRQRVMRHLGRVEKMRWINKVINGDIKMISSTPKCVRR